MSLTPGEFVSGAVTGATTPKPAPQTDLTKVKSKGRHGTTSPTGVPFWGEDPESWDHVIIRRTKLPGLCELRGHGYKQRLTRRKSPGKNGCTYTHLGVEAAEFEVTLLLWTEEHLREFAKLIPTLKPRKKTQKTVDRYKLAGYSEGLYGTTVAHEGVTGFAALNKSLAAKQKKTVAEGGTDPVSIYHPALVLYQIRACVILEASLPEKDHNGLYTVKLKCQEFVSGAALNGSVSTKKKSLNLSDLGPGAISRKLAAPTPADNNTGP